MAHSRGILFLDLYLLDLELKIQADRKSHRVHTTTTVTPEPLLPAEGEEGQPAGEEFPQEMSPALQEPPQENLGSEDRAHLSARSGEPTKKKGSPHPAGMGPIHVCQQRPRGVESHASRGDKEPSPPWGSRGSTGEARRLRVPPLGRSDETWGDGPSFPVQARTETGRQHP